jgi:Ras-related GTP-binding protein A/B
VVQSDLKYYNGAMEALAEYSREAQVFVLVHKMDLVGEEERDRVYAKRVAMIKAKSEGFDIETFRTSIWDETLYKAWSTIVYSLIPNIKHLEDNLKEFAELCDADEVVLFEKQTFLVISNTTRKTHPDMHRFEKISNIVKQFKLSCM